MDISVRMHLLLSLYIYKWRENLIDGGKLIHFLSTSWEGGVPAALVYLWKLHIWIKNIRWRAFDAPIRRLVNKFMKGVADSPEDLIDSVYKALQDRLDLPRVKSSKYLKTRNAVNLVVIEAFNEIREFRKTVKYLDQQASLGKGWYFCKYRRHQRSKRRSVPPVFSDLHSDDLTDLENAIKQIGKEFGWRYLFEQIELPSLDVH